MLLGENTCASIKKKVTCLLTRDVDVTFDNVGLLFPQL